MTYRQNPTTSSNDDTHDATTQETVMTRSILCRCLTLVALALCLATTSAEASSSVVRIEHGADNYVYTASGNAKSNADWGAANSDFLWVDAGDGKVAFRATNGAYLTAIGGGGAGVRADVFTLGENEKFLVAADVSGPWARILTRHGFPLCAESGNLHAKPSCFYGTKDFAFHETEDLMDDLVEASDHILIPTPGGEIKLPHDGLAIVDTVIDSRFGGVEVVSGITGNFGMPELPGGSGCGLWCNSYLGQLPESDLLPIGIGYDTPDNISETFDLPLDPDTKYFYLLFDTSSSISWRELTLEDPNGVGMILLIDHKAPTLFFYSTYLAGVGESFGLDEGGFGVSRRKSIRFEPDYDEGFEDVMTPFDGELYLSGTFSFTPEIENISLGVRGDAFFNVDRTKFATLQPDYVNKLGINADIVASLELSPFSLSLDLGGASAYYERQSLTDRWLVVSAELQSPDKILGLPLPFDANAQVTAYAATMPRLGDYASLVIDGSLQFPFSGGGFASQGIDGRLELTTFGTEFEGSLRFVGTTVSIAGQVQPTWAKFSGSVGVSWGIDSLTKVEADVDVTLDTRDTAIDLEASGKLCIKTPGFGWSCDSASASVSVNGSGRLKACVAGYCKTL